MKKVLSSAFATYSEYRKFKKTNKLYKIARYSLLAIFGVYGLILVFPQLIFAHKVSYKNFNVYARQDLGENINKVLDSAEARLVKSPIYKKDLPENIFIADTHGLYTFLTLKGNSLGSTIPVIGHTRINKSDIENDLVMRNSAPPNQRSLSGVIAHETMHNQLKEYFGLTKHIKIPTWKDEGYCEYIAGETTLSFEEGLKLWRESPGDSSKYDYFKYHQMVKYLLDDEKISVEELFDRDFDLKELEAMVLEKISK